MSVNRGRQHTHRFGDLRFNHFFRHAQLPRYFALGHVVDLAPHHDLPAARREPLELILEPPRQQVEEEVLDDLRAV